MEEVKEAAEERSSNHEGPLERLTLNDEAELNLQDTSHTSIDIKTSNDDEVSIISVLELFPNLKFL